MKNTEMKMTDWKARSLTDEYKAEQANYKAEQREKREKVLTEKELFNIYKQGVMQKSIKISGEKYESKMRKGLKGYIDTGNEIWATEFMTNGEGLSGWKFERTEARMDFLGTLKKA